MSVFDHSRGGEVGIVEESFVIHCILLEVIVSCLIMEV